MHIDFSHFFKDHKSLCAFWILQLTKEDQLKAFLFFCIFVWTPLSHSKRINSLSIKGNQIIETEWIRSHIQLKTGSPYSEKIVQKDVRQLFSLGFFDDIEVFRSFSKKGLNVVYQVKERTPIGKVEFKGNDSIKTEDLKELSLIKEYSFLNFDQLKKTLLAIKEKYKKKGYYLAEVSYKIKKDPQEKKKLKLIIEIKENTKLFIKRISFIGNRNVSSRALQALMLTKEQDVLSFISSSGIFQPKYIDRDLQFIEYYYRDKGYLNVRVHQPEITITPDKNFLYIYFSISEGPRFKIGQVDFRGDDIVPAEKVRDRLKLKETEYFSLGRLQEDIRLISFLYKNKGYAFVEVQPLFFPDPTEEDKVHILFKVDKGKAYKLRRIHLFGNKNARDKVILRRFRIREGELFSESKKELSRQLIQQLGYFDKVRLEPVPSTTETGELDLFVHVKERENTGEAHLAGGYNSQTRLFIQGGIKKQNFLGLDQSIALNVNFNKYNEIFALSYQNSYLLDTHWNFVFDAFNVSQNTLSGSSSSAVSFQSQDYFSYFQLNTGFSISLGRHLTEFSSVFLKYRLQKQSLQKNAVYLLRDLPVLAPVFRFLFGEKEEEDEEHLLREATFSDIYNLKEGNGLNSSLSAILEYDRRNDRYYASKGFFARLSAEYSGLGGDFDYTKWQGDLRHYYSPFWKLVIKNKLNYGWVFSNNKKKPVPFTELFLLGGPYNLRGFEVNSQGPRRFSQLAFDYALKNKLENPKAFAQRPYGGTQMFFYSLEFEFPIIERAELKGAFFFDLGEANDQLVFDRENQLRADAGVGIRWRSPLGPISLDWALPYKPRKEFAEQDWKFQFSIGSQF